MSSGAAHGNDQGGLPLLCIPGQQIADKIVEALKEFIALRVGKHIVPDSLVQAGQPPQLRNVVRIGQKAHVKDQVGLHRHPVLEAEGKDMHLHLPLLFPLGKEGQELAAQLAQGQTGGIHDPVRPLPQGSQDLPLHLDSLLQGVILLPQGMDPPGLLIALDNRPVRGVHEQNPVAALHGRQTIQGLEEPLKIGAAPDIGHQHHPVVLPISPHAQLGKFGDQRDGQVIHTKVAQVLHHRGRPALPCPGQTGNNQKLHKHTPQVFSLWGRSPLRRPALTPVGAPPSPAPRRSVPVRGAGPPSPGPARRHRWLLPG